MAFDSTPRTLNLRQRKMLAAVCIIGGVSLATAFGILGVLHLLPYLAETVGILVGLHLLPLAGVFHAPVVRTFGWAIALWSAGCLLLSSHGVWMSSAGTLVLAAILAAVLLAHGRGNGHALES